MSYRGEDLDLRTPQGRPSREGYTSEPGMNGTRPRAAAGPAGRIEALYVDDTVLAACNHAFDIAQAHGASEVRLEHLVHALTRVEAAAEILEQRGIREAHLRRESAAVIASEIPVGLAHSHSAPRASVEFEDVLRRSGDLSRGRGVAATVHDLLWVLLNYNREFPAVALVLRHALDWQQWDWPHQMDVRREAPRQYYTERRVYTEPVAPPPPPPREVTREVPRSRVIETRVEMPQPQPTVVYTQPTPPPPPQQVVVRESAPNIEPVYVRLDQMDGALRKLNSDMVNDRRAITDMLRDMQRELSGMRSNGSSVPAGMMDRLQGIEHAVDMRYQDFSRVASGLTERLLGLEKSVSNGMQEGARNWAAMGDRLKSLDKAITTQPANTNNGLADLITEQLVTVADQLSTAGDRIQALERGFESRQTESQRQWTTVVERLKGLDEAMGLQRRDAGDMKVSFAQMGSSGLAPLQTQMNERFQGVRQQLEQHGLAMTSLVAQVAEPLAERMHAVEKAIAARPADTYAQASEQMRAQLQQTQAQMDRASQQMNAQMAEAQTRLQSQMQQMMQGFTERLGQMEAVMGQRIVEMQNGLAAQAQQAMQAQSQPMERVAILERQLTAANQSLGQIVQRFGSVETLVQNHGERNVQYAQQLAQQAATTHSRELADLQEAILKLGTNQSTLSENLDQWRTENEGGLSILSNRLELIERASAQPSQLLKQVQVDLEAMQRVTLADYDQNRRGIRNWLFGTEQIFAGTWRDETRQIRDRLKQMREDRKA